MNHGEAVYPRDIPIVLFVARRALTAMITAESRHSCRLRAAGATHTGFNLAPLGYVRRNAPRYEEIGHRETRKLDVDSSLRVGGRAKSNGECVVQSAFIRLNREAETESAYLSTQGVGVRVSRASGTCFGAQNIRLKCTALLQATTS